MIINFLIIIKEVSMSFTTQTFIFIFFPACILIYYTVLLLEKNKMIAKFLKKIRLTDIILICFSLGFYMWVCFDDVSRLLIYIVFIYFSGKMIECRRYKKYLLTIDSAEEMEEHSYKKISYALPIVLLCSVAIVFVLVYYKYTHILVDIWNFLFKREIQAQSYLAPLGISFITFSAISYIVDIYRGDAKSGGVVDCLLYLSFFPKVVSGPVVLWKDFANQLFERKCSLDRGVYSINRIMIGFAKKLILADQFGAFIAKIPLYEGSMDPITTLAVMFAYMLQIYFDFSGYSDIAIGLSGLFGFNFNENFNFPYCSVSISEFWRRWHISLGRWFKEYVYIPLGGSRSGIKRTIFNQAIVFLLTGLWHGAGWNYLIWGCMNGFFVILERIIANKKVYERVPKGIKWLATLCVTFVAWQLFRLPSLYDLKVCFGNLFGAYSLEYLPYTWKYYIHARIVLLMIIGSVGATLLSSLYLQKVYKKISNTVIGFALQEAILIVLFVVSILCMVNSTYSPFIYFQY